MSDLVVHGGRSAGADELAIPADKSLSHRVLTIAAAAPGTTRIHNLNDSDSVLVLVDALVALGVDIERSSRTELAIGSIPRMRRAVPTIDFGPSSAAARHLLGQLVALGVEAICDGDARLRAQPMAWVVDPLRELGAAIDYGGEPGRLPVHARTARLRSGTVSTAVGSAQARSVLLIAANTAAITVRIRYPVRSRDHTERLLRYLGVTIDDTNGVLEIRGAGVAPIDELGVPGDPSAAAYPIAAHVLSRSPRSLSIHGVCLNPTRTGFLELIGRMGVEIRLEGVTERYGEPVGTIVVAPAPAELRPFAIDDPFLFHALIDEVPLAFAVAARANGTSTLSGGDELVFKETNRLESTRAMLAAFGADVAVAGTSLRITGGTLRPGRVPSFGDHRVAMAAAVLASSLDGTSRIDGGSCFRTSFPSFVECLRAGGWQLGLEEAT